MVQDVEYVKINLYNNKNELMVSSTQCSVNEEDSTIIVKTDKTSLFNAFQFVHVELLTDRGIQQADGFVRLIISDEQISIMLKHFEGEIEERREFLKVPCALHLEMTEIQVDGQETKFDRPVPIIVRNISLGGMMFSAPVLFELGAQGHIVFSEGKRPCYLFFTIVRVEDYSSPEIERPTDEVYDYRYGCRFETLNDDAETSLCSYVLQEDAMRRKKKRDIMGE